MLFPLSADQSIRRTPVVTYLLIAACVGVYLLQMYWQQTLDPDRYHEKVGSWMVWREAFRWHTLITCAFLHGGLWHLAGNMLFLWTFGPAIEDRFGSVRFLLFYLAGAAAASGLHLVASPNPALGASGAIASVTGAFMVLYPFVPVRFFSLYHLGVIAVPGWWLVGFAIVWDLIMQSAGVGRVAHAAHLGGYAWGIGLCMVLLWTHALKRSPYDLFSMANQYRRRREIRGLAHAQERERVSRFERAKVDPQAVAEAERLGVARSLVVRHLNTGDLPQAMLAYRALADGFANVPKATTLSRPQQLQIGTAFHRAGDALGAAYAFDRFVEAYPNDPDTPQIQLLLAIIYGRTLNDPVRAKTLIAAAMTRLSDQERVMATRELEALG